MSDLKKPQDPMKVMFPEETVSDGDFSVTARPLSLAQMPSVMDAFTSVMQMVEKGAGPAEIASRGLKELLILLPNCINKPAEEVPASLVPELVEVVVRQNMSEAVLEKWKALVDQVTDLGEKARALPGNSPS